MALKNLRMVWIGRTLIYYRLSIRILNLHLLCWRIPFHSSNITQQDDFCTIICSPGNCKHLCSRALYIKKKPKKEVLLPYAGSELLTAGAQGCPCQAPCSPWALVTGRSADSLNSFLEAAPLSCSPQHSLDPLEVPSISIYTSGGGKINHLWLLAVPAVRDALLWGWGWGCTCSAGGILPAWEPEISL